MLMLASQRIESVIGGWFWGEESVEVDLPTKRGATPTVIEWLILSWVSGKLFFFSFVLKIIIFYSML